MGTPKGPSHYFLPLDTHGVPQFVTSSVGALQSKTNKRKISAQPKMTLPEKITAGDVTDVQLSPYGEFEQVLPDGRRVVQIVDGEALRNILLNFSARLRPSGILVDADHQSEEGGSTEALAWSATSGFAGAHPEGHGCAI